MRTAGELHLTICAEWAEDNFGVNFDVNRIDPFSRTYAQNLLCSAFVRDLLKGGVCRKAVFS